VPKITPFLWFDGQAEEAANFYVSLFPNSQVRSVSHYGEAGPREAGMVMVVTFELDGQPYRALNGGPEFTFDEAISFEIECETQAEVDAYWSRLGEGGQEGPCGWLKDRYGVSWQVVPRRLGELIQDPATGQSVMAAMLRMGKLDIAALEAAAAAATPA
jgi:predicted 3-demethylubiquinone-9 3-methyltransferase (glyoxalase superfamily)